MVDDQLTVAQAAKILEVTPDAVRKLLGSGDLAGNKRGRDWVVDGAAVERRRRRPPSTGRPLAALTSWGVILEHSPRSEFERASEWTESARSCGRGWLANHDPLAEAGRLRARARLERFDAHPSQIPRLLDRHVLVTGISAAETVGLSGGPLDAAELYAPIGARPTFQRLHGLAAGDGPIAIRWVDDELWNQLTSAALPWAPGRPNFAPRLAVLLDLLESDDPRARREAARALAA